MVFTKNSALVKAWVGLVLCGAFSPDTVPNLFNLRTVVLEITNGLM